ncbi:hypothetical protein C8R45DRAFT_923327 [Mycena sanguinolenta]|nr:hypothetical protein C8R45DRAFT_923327 [Mycena sanguinolenta]
MRITRELTLKPFGLRLSGSVNRRRLYSNNVHGEIPVNTRGEYIRGEAAHDDRPLKRMDDKPVWVKQVGNLKALNGNNPHQSGTRVNHRPADFQCRNAHVADRLGYRIACNVNVNPYSSARNRDPLRLIVAQKQGDAERSSEVESADATKDENKRKMALREHRKAWVETGVTGACKYEWRKLSTRRNGSAQKGVRGEIVERRRRAKEYRNMPTRIVESGGGRDVGRIAQMRIGGGERGSGAVEYHGDVAEES